MTDFALVRKADFYLAYRVSDYPFEHIVAHGGARLIEGAPPEIPNDPFDVDDFWRGTDSAPLSLTFAHFWRQRLDFTFVDIGANVGRVTAEVGRFFHRAGRRNPIHAFEPGPGFDCLERTIGANGIEANLHRLAVADHVGTVTFHEMEGNSSGNSLFAEIGERGSFRINPTEMRCTTVDAFLAENRIASHLVCKVDTEGADFLVIEGMRRAIVERFVAIFFEFTPWLVEKYADPTARLAQLAEDFCLLDYVDNHLYLVPPASIPDFVARLRSESAQSYTDILALPRRLPGLAELLARAGAVPARLDWASRQHHR
jgi:FkbM family methyltransferase